MPGKIKTGPKYPNGTRVRFVKSDLGASERDDLSHVVEEKFGVGDEGVIAFPHPNKTIAVVGWCYVEVQSKTIPGRLLYVGVRANMIEPIA